MTNTRTWLTALSTAIALLVPLYAAQAETLSATAMVAASVTEIRSGEIGEEAQASQTLPVEGAQLPLQVVARLIDAELDAAALAAAQFSDPTTAALPDPDEFAISMALDSLATELAYTGQATAEEARSTVFTASELRPASTGDVVRVYGRVYLDGVLAVFAEQDVSDLTGCSITMRFTVTKEVPGSPPQEVCVATLTVTGGPDRQVSAVNGERFPELGLFRTDLSGVDDKLSVFQAFAFPAMVIEYPYDVTVGEVFTLRGRLEVNAANTPGGTGVTALIGTPIDKLKEIVAAAQGEELASKMIAALERERENPSGEPALVDRAAPLAGLLGGSCGLLGLEVAVGAFGLVGLRAAGVYRRRGTQ